MVKVNGEIIDASGKSIAALLEDMNFSDGRVAVELNEMIVPRNTYHEKIIKDGDSVEIVRFVGGG